MELKKILEKINVKADWICLRKISERITHRLARNGSMDNFVKSADRGVMVEVMLNGQIAYGATDNLTVEGIQKAAERASQLTEQSALHNLFSFTQEQRPPAVGDYVSPYKKPIDSLSEGEIFDVLIDLSIQLKVGEKIKQTRAHCMEIFREIEFVSSNGSDFKQTFLIHDLSLQATASEGSEHQSRSISSGTHQVGLEIYDRTKWTTAAQRVGAEALELLEAKNCPTQTCDLLLTPDQLYLQVHESIGHPLELDRILGDERNYAGWSFVQKEDFGHLQYGSKLLNVTFDPTLKGETATYLFDDVGQKAEKEYLIKEGKLLRGLGGLESQVRSQILGVANSRASSWNRPPTDRMANINIEPGDSSFDDMIASVEKGVLMMTNKSWSIDDYRNKFQFGCEYGKLIENGRITETVKNPNYRGTTTPFWKQLSMVGNVDTYEVFGSPYCGKAEPNQVIRVGHATPACLFKGIQTFGGA